MQEYEEADYISIPSTFVKNSFIEKGIPEAKLIVNGYGVSEYFSVSAIKTQSGKFTILYVGALTIQKGLIYLFKALHELQVPDEDYEVWFIGTLDEEMKATVEEWKKPNWKLLGQVDHYNLSKYIQQCDVSVFPSLQDGYGMVILQLLSCGLPVIASTNTGGPDVITEGQNGFIVPIRSSAHIAEKLKLLYDDPALLASMKRQAAASIDKGNKWSDYGDRYVSFLKQLANGENGTERK